MSIFVCIGVLEFDVLTEYGMNVCDFYPIGNPYGKFEQISKFLKYDSNSAAELGYQVD